MIASTTVSCFITRRLSTSSNKIMGFTKEIIRNGNGSKPSVGQTVTGMYIRIMLSLALVLVNAH